MCSESEPDARVRRPALARVETKLQWRDRSEIILFYFQLHPMGSCHAQLFREDGGRFGLRIRSDGACLHADEAENEKLLAKVMTRLMSADMVSKEYPKKFDWPPKFFVKPKSKREVNAYASAHKLHGATLDEKTGKIRPVVMASSRPFMPPRRK
jgi:hypothetical protein